MAPNIVNSLLLFTSLFLTAQAAVDPQLTGTWSSKSRKVITGPGFYDPISDRLKEPPLTGISYSFTDDGYYEEAYYRAIAQPSNPECAEGLMQWQHGTYSLEPNGSLVLTPFTSDGRQLISNPCAGEYASYTRYNQTEVFKSYSVYTDPFHNVPRLDLYEFDGTPMQPLYLVYKPPEMLPTTTLNPTVMVTATVKAKAKRDAVFGETPHQDTFLRRLDSATLDRWWWIGVIMTSLGGVVLLCS
ncbi:hypothetical protein VTN77DRAFT_7348 [Rasamsonia byssochlamydoides]|uniref:uncharacterized protein n=1 Tax=Rasamsonia byssochlamydoides TaxID=89139 RepID=UPI0037420161